MSGDTTPKIDHSVVLSLHKCYGLPIQSYYDSQSKDVKEDLNRAAWHYGASFLYYAKCRSTFHDDVTHYQIQEEVAQDEVASQLSYDVVKERLRRSPLKEDNKMVGDLTGRIKRYFTDAGLWEPLHRGQSKRESLWGNSPEQAYSLVGPWISKYWEDFRNYGAAAFIFQDQAVGVFRIGELVEIW